MTWLGQESVEALAKIISKAHCDMSDTEREDNSVTTACEYHLSTA